MDAINADRSNIDKDNRYRYGNGGKKEKLKFYIIA